MAEAMGRRDLFDWLLEKIGDLIRTPMPLSDVLYGVCDMLREMVPEYDWVGFYFVDRRSERELVLGPYAGDSTEHVRIPFGKGICGQAAEKGETFVVQDVSRESNYLSCSVNVRSEIVVPIFRGGTLIGELDIDSHRANAFDKDDREFLKRVVELLENVV